MTLKSLAMMAAAALTAALLGSVPARAQTATQVGFPSQDGITQLRAFVWKPAAALGAGPFPAVVLMHGCGGAYSKTSNGANLTAATIESNPVQYINSQFKDWGKWLAERGYVALLVDGFGPRGQTLGVCDIPWNDRVGTSLDEVRRRPLDAFAGLKYLRDNAAALKVNGQKVGIVGWSNGASAVLSTIAQTGPAVWHANTLAANPGLVGGFSVALSYYPGCGLDSQFKATYRPGTPLQMFVGMRDTVTPPTGCFTLQATASQLAAAANEPTGFDLKAYADATHSFDQKTNSAWTAEQTALNNAAKDDARAMAETLFQSLLKP